MNKEQQIRHVPSSLRISLVKGKMGRGGGEEDSKMSFIYLEWPFTMRSPLPNNNVWQNWCGSPYLRGFFVLWHISLEIIKNDNRVTFRGQRLKTVVVLAESMSTA